MQILHCKMFFIAGNVEKSFVCKNLFKLSALILLLNKYLSSQDNSAFTKLLVEHCYHFNLILLIVLNLKWRNTLYWCFQLYKEQLFLYGTKGNKKSNKIAFLYIGMQTILVYNLRKSIKSMKLEKCLCLLLLLYYLMNLRISEQCIFPQKIFLAYGGI